MYLRACKDSAVLHWFVCATKLTCGLGSGSSSILAHLAGLTTAQRFFGFRAVLVNVMMFSHGSTVVLHDLDLNVAGEFFMCPCCNSVHVFALAVMGFSRLNGSETSGHQDILALDVLLYAYTLVSVAVVYRSPLLFKKV